MIRISLVLAGILVIFWAERGRFVLTSNGSRFRYLLWAGSLCCILLAAFPLVRPASEGPEAGSVEILLLDVSASISESQRIELISNAEKWTQVHPTAEVFVFGEGTDSLDVMLARGQTEPAHSSNLGTALQEIGAFLGSRTGEITIATDWNVDQPGLIVGLLERLAAQGHRVRALSVEEDSDAHRFSIPSVSLPSFVWEGDRLTFAIAIWSDREAPVLLEVFAGDTTLFAQRVELREGFQEYQVPIQTGAAGFLSLEARVSSVDSSRTESVARFASLNVREFPNILALSEPNTAVSRLVTSLRTEGFDISTFGPGEITGSIDQLADLDVILLNNVRESNIGGAGFDALNWFVNAHGGGLVVVGGQESFTLGGYEDSDFAQLLPVAMAAPARGERAPMAFVLILDRSGSMAGPVNPPILLAQIAALEVVDILGSGDLFGLLSYSDDVRWDVPLALIDDAASMRAAADAIGQLQASGGTYMLAAFQEAILRLKNQTGGQQSHILLLSDGISNDGEITEFIRIAREAAIDGIAISTIALGDLSDVQTLAGIAEAGGGRFYYVGDPTDLPEVVVAETRAARSENVQVGTTNLVSATAGNPILVGYSDSELPVLSSYLALTPRTDRGARVFLESGNFGDPILAGWQVGRGRVLAWAGDLGQEWNREWPGWQGYGEFWGQVLKYSAAGRGIPEASFSIGSEHGGRDVTLEAASPEFLSSEIVPQLLLELKDGAIRGYPMLASGIDAYSAKLGDLEPGVYPIRLDLRDREVAGVITINAPDDLTRGIAASTNDLLGELLRTGLVEQVSEDVVFGEAIGEADEESAPSTFFPNLLGLLGLAGWVIYLWMRNKTTDRVSTSD